MLCDGAEGVPVNHVNMFNKYDLYCTLYIATAKLEEEIKCDLVTCYDKKAAEVSIGFNELSCLNKRLRQRDDGSRFIIGQQLLPVSHAGSRFRKEGKFYICLFDS